jgi:hypothetical protein
MKYRIFPVIALAMAVSLSACKYRKGDMYTRNLQGDSLVYMILEKGRGEKIINRAAQLKLQHEYKGNSCQVRFVSDSAALHSGKGFLLFNATLPDIENDMLTKGFFGTFTSKQQVVYLLVSSGDFSVYFHKKESMGQQQ